MRRRNSNLYLTREQVEHLSELGVKFEKPLLCFNKKHYWEDEKDKLRLYSPNQCDDPIPTPTFQELWDLMPKLIDEKYELVLYMSGVLYGIAYCNPIKEGDSLVEKYSETSMVDAAYQMFCWWLEEGRFKF